MDPSNSYLVVLQHAPRLSQYAFAKCVRQKCDQVQDPKSISLSATAEEEKEEGLSEARDKNCSAKAMLTYLFSTLDRQSGMKGSLVIVAIGKKAIEEDCLSLFIQ